MNPNVFFDLIIYVIAILLVFILLREFWCWYFKINKITELLEKLVKNTSGDPILNESSRWKCPECNKYNQGDTFECEHCGYKLK